MFFRMLWRAALVRRGRALAALIAIAVAAAVATTLLNLYEDAMVKFQTQLRSYGANALVVAPQGSSLPVGTLAKVDSVLGVGNTAVPFAYVVARTENDQGGTPVVVAGTDMARVRVLNSWWSVTSWPGAAEGSTIPALFGARAAKALSPENKPVQLWFSGKTATLVPAGILTTGSDDDSRVFIDLAALNQWTGAQPSTISMAISGSRTEVESKIRELQAALPSAQVTPVRQITEAETRVLGKTRSALMAASAVVILTAALCVLATLISFVLDRRRDFAVMKALGASERLVSAFFASEAGLLGALGGLVGFCIGIGAAALIGRINFQSVVMPHFALLPEVMAGGIGIALVAAAAPLGILRRIQPAAILRGE
jgi:putative ABC transport system permease protein